MRSVKKSPDRERSLRDRRNRKREKVNLLPLRSSQRAVHDIHSSYSRENPFYSAIHISLMAKRKNGKKYFSTKFCKTG